MIVRIFVLELKEIKRSFQIFDWLLLGEVVIADVFDKFWDWLLLDLTWTCKLKEG